MLLLGNTTSAIDRDTKICVLYSCKSPLTTRLSCLLASLSWECRHKQMLVPVFSLHALFRVSSFFSVSFPWQRLLENHSKRRRGFGSRLILAFGVRFPRRINMHFSCPRVMLGTARETVISWNVGLFSNFAHQQDLEWRVVFISDLKKDLCVPSHVSPSLPPWAIAVLMKNLLRNAISNVTFEVWPCSLALFVCFLPSVYIQCFENFSLHV